MSQYTRQDNGSSSPDVETLTGNSGGAVGPDGSFNINTLGTGSITIVGSPGTNTLTTQLTGLTDHSLLVGAGTATITNLGVATNGQIPIGSTGADPVLALPTSTGGTIDITAGAGTLNFEVNSLESGTGQTVGAVTDDVITFAMGGTPRVVAFDVTVVSFDSSTPAGASYNIFGSVRTDGASATLCGTPDVVTNEEAALAAAAADLVVSGNNAIIQVTGVGGLTIDWVARARYVEVS